MSLRYFLFYGVMPCVIIVLLPPRELKPRQGKLVTTSYNVQF